MKVAIIDDETIILDKIKTIILENTLISGFDIDLYSNPLTFLNHKQNYDLVLLDLKMPEIHGFNVAKQLKNQNTLIIYITNMVNQMHLAFDYHVVGFIIKEQLETTLIPALNQAINKINQLKPITITKNQEVYRYYPNEIYYFSYEDRQLTVYLKNRIDYLGFMTLKEVSYNLLASFIQINRHQIVNIEAVSSFRNNIISFENSNRTVKVSRRKGNEVFNTILKTIESL